MFNKDLHIHNGDVKYALKPQLNLRHESIIQSRENSGRGFLTSIYCYQKGPKLVYVPKLHIL